jgi:RNA polymerase sigma factor (sigma-70 family)
MIVREPGEADATREVVALDEGQRALAEEHVGVAIAYVRSRRYLMREEEDNTQVGLLAITMAAARYGAHVGCDFGTYAYQRVRRAVADHLAANRPIRIPTDGHKARWKSRRPGVEAAKRAAESVQVIGLGEVRNGDEFEELGRSREPRPDEAAEEAEAAEAVRAAVEALPEDLRATVRAVCLEGRGMAEYAREQGRWPSSVSNQRARAFKAMQRTLESRGWTIDDAEYAEGA